MNDRSLERPLRREVVQVAVSSNAKREVVVALCNDGAVAYFAADTGWKMLPEILQDGFDEANVPVPLEGIRLRR